MKIPPRLKRNATPPSCADAFLLPDADFASLATVHARLAGIRAFPVRGGFLILPHEATATAVPGAIRLHRLGGDLFIPRDATLQPSLLPDEIAALTHERGLIVLPDRSILAFDLRLPIPVSRWLAPVRVKRDAWEPLPMPPALAERLVKIEAPTPPAAVIEILAAGEPDDAEPLPGAGESASNSPREDARPPRGSTLGRAAAGMGLAAGGMLAWLGRNLGMPGLAKAGADLARKALEAVPRLTEKIFGEQEAALRDVLRELEEGNVEKALRRAPPAVADPDAPVRVDAGANLGWRDPRYSLRDLIGGGGVGGTWLGGGDLWAKLADQYRRLAQEAGARGDFRRAAYLYGKLLRDFRSAANVLLSGGLFRDAAILLRDKVKDEPAAATAFEKAGDFDEALRLYDKLSRFEQAGDLLMKLEDVPRARTYFLRAADVLAGFRQWLAAGDLLWTKLADRAEACRYFQAGWESESADMMPCGKRLLREHLVAQEWPEAVTLFDKAEARFAPPRAEDARVFFNSAIQDTLGRMPEPFRDDLTDRSLLLFAEHLRAAKRGGTGERRAAEFFGTGDDWPAPVARDALYASSSRLKSKTPTLPPPIDVAYGTVAAVAFARDAGWLVIATDRSLTLWRPNFERRVIHRMDGERVLGLSIDPDAKIVYMLCRSESRVYVLGYANVGDYWQNTAQIEFGETDDDHWHLEPQATRSGADWRVTVADPAGREMIFGHRLRHSVPIGYRRNGPHTHLLATTDRERFWDWDSRFMHCLDASGKQINRWLPRWKPAIPLGSTLTVPPLDWMSADPRVLEIAGVDAEGILYWSLFNSQSVGGDGQFWSDTAEDPHRFLAACIVSPGSVIGATVDNKLFWVRRSLIVELKIADDVLRQSPSRVAALVATRRGKEVLVVFEDGSVVPISNWS